MERCTPLRRLSKFLLLPLLIDPLSGGTLHAVLCVSLDRPRLPVKSRVVVDEGVTA